MTALIPTGLTGDPATASAHWRDWTTDVELTVTDPAALSEATSVCREVMDEIDRACSRYRPDSELAQIARLAHAHGATAQVSPRLERLLADALVAARATDGLVDPTLGHRLAQLDGPDVGVPVAEQRRLAWSDVTLEDGMLTVPSGTWFDLGAIGKASAADQVVEAVRSALGQDLGVLVGIGGDVATSPTGPEEGWQILVQDLPGDPSDRISLSPGAGVATSSTQRRRHRRGAETLSHILDPRSLDPVESPWRTVTCAAASCAEANAWSTAAVILGTGAVDWLGERGIAARLVDQDYRVVTTSDWPVQDVSSRV